ncbi:MAG: c-type cytochrome [Mesorhizobium sp.]
MGLPIERMAIAALVLMSAVGMAQAQDAEAGKKAFARCMACHDAEKDVNKVGPTLKGIVGRRAGTVSRFRYSPAMKAAGEGGLVWDEPNLARYLADPKAAVSGNRMAFPGLKDPDEIRNVIAYLKAVSG